MREWLVKVEGVAHETYYVEADTAEEAMDNWHAGNYDGVWVDQAAPVSAEPSEDDEA